jgi:hypothetical protein
MIKESVEELEKYSSYTLLLISWACTVREIYRSSVLTFFHLHVIVNNSTTALCL